MQFLLQILMNNFISNVFAFDISSWMSCSCNQRAYEFNLSIYRPVCPSDCRLVLLCFPPVFCYALRYRYKIFAYLQLPIWITDVPIFYQAISTFIALVLCSEFSFKNWWMGVSIKNASMTRTCNCSHQCKVFMMKMLLSYIGTFQWLVGCFMSRQEFSTYIVTSPAVGQVAQI